MITREPTPAASALVDRAEDRVDRDGDDCQVHLAGDAPMDGQAGTPETLSAVLLTG